MRIKGMNRKGFTLAETLIVVLLLGILTSAGAAGISAVMATRVTMIQTADAGILNSTALQSIANEVRFGQNIQVDENGEYIILDSLNYGAEVKIYQKNGKLMYGDQDKVLSEHTYSGLTISGLSFELKDDGAITIFVEVSGNSGKLWDGELSVVPLNGPVEVITSE